MHRRQMITLVIGLLAILTLSACSQDIDTSNWEVFSIENAPGFDIRFLIPPDWDFNYILPGESLIGQWEITLTPPRCSSDQSVDYEEDCISINAFIKGEAEFNEDEVLALISQNIILSEEEDAESILMGQSTFEVDGLTIQRFNHKINSAAGEVQLSYYYFQTDNAYYTIMAHFPYDEREEGPAEELQEVIRSITVVE